MSSKTSKKTCQFIVKRGPNKGNKCGRGCRDGFCKDHKPKKIDDQRELKKKVYFEQKKEKVISKFKELKDDGYGTDLTQAGLKVRGLQDQYNYLERLRIGCELAIDPNYKIPLRKKIEREIASKEFAQEAQEEYNELDEKSKKRYGYFEGYLEHSKERYLSYPNTHINPITFSGKKTDAVKKLTEIERKKSALLKDIIIMRKFHNDLENAIDEANKLIETNENSEKN